MNWLNGKRQTDNTFLFYFCVPWKVASRNSSVDVSLDSNVGLVPASAWIVGCALERRRFRLQGNSTSAASSSCLRAANVYPAPESLRKLRSKFSLSSHRLRQSSSHRYRRRRGPERDAAGENDLGTIAGKGPPQASTSGGAYPPAHGSSRRRSSVRISSIGPDRADRFGRGSKRSSVSLTGPTELPIWIWVAELLT